MHELMRYFVVSHMAKNVAVMCIDMLSQPGDIIFRWSVDEVSLGVSRECVLDHTFDTVGVYNVCVAAFNSGQLTCLISSLAPFPFLVFPLICSKSICRFHKYMVILF